MSRRKVRHYSYNIKFQLYYANIISDNFSGDFGRMAVGLIRPTPELGGQFGGGPKFGIFSKFIGLSGGLPDSTGDFLGIWSAGVNGHNFG